MASFVAYPKLKFEDSYGQPSDGYIGRRLRVTFDSSNIYTRISDGYFTNNTLITLAPVIVTIYGTTAEGPLSENFSFVKLGISVDGSMHFTSFYDVSVSGNKIFAGSPYGAIDVKELLPLSISDDGYNNQFLKNTAYGNGIFVFTDKDGNPYNPGYGEYEFEYAAPFQIDLKTAPTKLYIGNDINLQHAIDGTIDEVKITSATATKTRTRNLAGSYDISIEASSPVFGEPDSKTLVLLHLNDNSNFIMNSIREPLDSANLTDSVLSTIVSLRNDRVRFINYVDSLHITGSIVDESLDTRPVSEQLFDLVTVLNNMVNYANYYKISGNFLPSEITVNDSFKYAAVFSGAPYFIEKSGLINNDHGSIELWIAPLSNLLGDFNRKIYLDSINHAIIGKNGDLISITGNLIELPNNIIAQYINSIHVFENGLKEFNFADFAHLSDDGTFITLAKPLPSKFTSVIIDYIPMSSSNDRLTLYKDEDSNLVFSISANTTLYHLSHDISNWKKNEWHRIMITWKANDKNNLNRINMFVDGIESTIIKYGEGYLFNTFKFNEEHQANINTKIFAQNIQFLGNLDKLHIGTDFLSMQPASCRMANLRVSFIERTPVIDARGNKIDFDFDGGSKSATPELNDIFTEYLEDFDPQNGFITNFASAQNPVAGAHDLQIIIRDDFHLVRGVNNGQVERLLRELIKIIHPAEARTRIRITTND